MARILTHREARRVYDRIGSLQDTQAFYEDRATTALLRHGEFAAARSVFEFGCGTGRFAQRLLAVHLPPDARYRGIDLSPKMVSLARARLAPYASRAEVLFSEGGPPVDQPSGAFDRFVSNYVFDLLSEGEICAVLREARRMLRPGGLLGLTGLSTGVGAISRAVARAWSWLQARHPQAVGGCRPLDLRPFLASAHWEIRHDARVVAFGVPSEVLVAQKRSGSRDPRPDPRRVGAALGIQ